MLGRDADPFVLCQAQLGRTWRIDWSIGKKETSEKLSVEIEDSRSMITTMNGTRKSELLVRIETQE